MITLVRELPSLRVNVDVQTPRGHRYRWADDEPTADCTPNGVQWSSTMPGGWETCDTTLPRDPSVASHDIEGGSTLSVLDAAAEKIGEFRLESAPFVSGDQMSVSPSAVGWQAALDDNKAVAPLYVDRSRGSWGEPSLERQAELVDGSDPFGVHVYGSGMSLDGLIWNLETEITESNDVVEAWWRALSPSVRAAIVQYRVRELGDWSFMEDATLYSNDVELRAGWTADLLTVDDTLRTVVLATPSRYLVLRARTLANQTLARGTQRDFRQIAVYGDHGLPLYPTYGPDPDTGLTVQEPDGVLMSDVVRHAVTSYAPILQVTADSIQQSSFVVAQLAFDDTSAGEIVKTASRFELQDWAVWNDRVFWWHPRGAHGRRWRARTGPSGLQGTGAQMNRVWESIIVAYQDYTGQTRTVGPLGSGADTESALLRDPDDENPWRKLGVIRRDKLAVGTMDRAGAIEIGRRFLAEARQLDQSGSARIVGHIDDHRGITHPYHHIRAGDTIEFIDAANTNPRRIVKASNDTTQSACSIDLDTPPEALAALLERLGAVLAPLDL